MWFEKTWILVKRTVSSRISEGIFIRYLRQKCKHRISYQNFSLIRSLSGQNSDNCGDTDYGDNYVYLKPEEKDWRKWEKLRVERYLTITVPSHGLNLMKGKVLLFRTINLSVTTDFKISAVRRHFCCLKRIV